MKDQRSAEFGNKDDARTMREYEYHGPVWVKEFLPLLVHGKHTGISDVTRLPTKRIGRDPS